MEAAVTYLVDTGVKPIAYASAGGAAVGRNTGQFEQRRVAIRDARAAGQAFSLDREGFSLVAHATAVTDFYDEAQIADVYTPEIERLVGKASGAQRVVVFDFTRRSDAVATRDAHSSREPARTIHNDFTAWSARERLRRALGDDEAARRGRRRFAIINVWRPMRSPVETAPLAVCDATSVAEQDLIKTERRSAERVGEILQAVYNPSHRWYYYPHMTPSEALLLKTYDSADDGRARSTLHTAFDPPGAPADAAPRESIEARAFAFY